MEDLDSLECTEVVEEMRDEAEAEADAEVDVAAEVFAMLVEADVIDLGSSERPRADLAARRLLCFWLEVDMTAPIEIRPTDNSCAIDAWGVRYH